jgi:hypothetical protein
MASWLISVTEVKDCDAAVHKFTKIQHESPRSFFRGIKRFLLERAVDTLTTEYRRKFQELGVEDWKVEG